jgi:flagellar basal body-associated protein FliL
MKRKILTTLIVIIIIALASSVYYRYYFVFGEGVKAGQLNYFVKKGYMFKTYEGRLIQAGLQSQQPGHIVSNEFMFSVTDPKVADKLNHDAGGFLQLHYKEYLHALPWRGITHFVVDSVLTAEPTNVTK